MLSAAPYKFHNEKNLLNKTPAYFVIAELGWNFKLFFEGTDKKGKYVLLLDGTPVEELNRLDYKRDVPPLSRSKVLTVEKGDYKLTTYQPFIDGVIRAIAFE